MNALKKITVWLVATSLALAAAAMLVPKETVAAMVGNVFLVNHSVPASNPLPVAGNVGINGTPTMQLAGGTSVGINGTPTVQLAGGANVGINNLPAVQMTRDKDNPALAPFQTTMCGGAAFLSSPCPLADPSSFTVGANHRLVIEYVSVECNAIGTNWFVMGDFLQTTVGGNSSNYSFPPGQMNGALMSIANQQTRIYADPGTTVGFNVIGLSGSGSGQFSCFAMLSGNLVTP